MTVRPLSLARRLGRDRSGVALLEFAFSLPLVLGVGMYATETASLALANLRVSQVALNLADNAARVGEAQSNNTQRLREIDINDVLTAARLQGERWGLTTRGRIILSSLENTSGTQMIHWQRCIGLRGSTTAEANYRSSYGITATDGKSTGSTYDPTAGVDTDTGPGDNSATHPGSKALGTTGNLGDGMGDAGAKVTAPPDSGVMFVEINYEYDPVVSSSWLPSGSTRIKYIASFVVRDQRVFSQVFNPDPAAKRWTCDKYFATEPAT
jgi:hypothetical protein